MQTYQHNRIDDTVDRRMRPDHSIGIPGEENIMSSVSEHGHLANHHQMTIHPEMLDKSIDRSFECNMVNMSTCYANLSAIPVSPPKHRDDASKQRLLQVKDVLKNSQTLKEQLKGVCLCYDNYVGIQPQKEDQKALSLMKNFFLQIVNKSQGEIIKYKQAYETQRERRKELEAKLSKAAEEMQRESSKHLEQSDIVNKRESHY